ncbi:MAG: nucleotide exchange factor GrpE [Planctomycetaceae bacterium]|nr:nucleotide exchange factor GrpE [Planctomycetaceae bacterium]
MSNEAENNTQNFENIDQVLGDGTDNSSSITPESPVTADQLKQELTAAMERALRAQAELENFRKRVYRDTEQQLKFASIGLLKDVLEVADNLQRALDAANQSDSTGSVAQGIQMVQNQLTTVLGKHGCVPIEAIGKPFDPNFHEALTQMPSADQPAGNILQELRRGYMLHERVVRPSQVILSSGAQ